MIYSNSTTREVYSATEQKDKNDELINISNSNAEDIIIALCKKAYDGTFVYPRNVGESKGEWTSRLIANARTVQIKEF